MPGPLGAIRRQQFTPKITRPDAKKKDAPGELKRVVRLKNDYALNERQGNL